MPVRYRPMRYFWWFWYRVIGLAAYIIASRKKETRRAYGLLEELEKRFDGHFRPATRRKIAVSYGIYNPMVCDAFARLAGKTTQPAEKHRYMLYFVCSSLFDDFTDYDLVTAQELENLSFRPETYAAGTFDEQVFRYAHQQLRNAVRDKVAYDRVTRALFAAQRDSRAQAGNTLGHAELERITLAKGGNSVLLCGYYLDMPAGPAEAACWYSLGSLIQLTNDLYDIHKDLTEGFTTPANSMTDAYAFESFFLSQIAEMKKCIRALPVPAGRRRTFSLCMAGIYAFGLIALEQLKRIQAGASRLPALSSLPRQALIIDMEKPANLARWFKFTYRHARL